MFFFFYFLMRFSRRVMSLSLEGCSLLTMDGFEPVVLSWKELKRLTVVSCNNIKDSAMTPELATLFSLLKELKWRPDSKSILSSGFEGTGVWQKGGRSFKI
ncbi:putative leucine-rich repeat domain superfamily [Helianthus annuus]|nr:putative leucine-rich repeat domain superfamily [Helianthus annuus]KAJ0739815.1 putative leucine-rich repeat domain superfamily [Helianthus annuus]KAJ0803393.1 putative leucine-rich repeat domain superfamily [Helianthus annuus]